MIAYFKEVIMKEFEITNLGLMKCFFGILVEQARAEIFIYQEEYTRFVEEVSHGELQTNVNFIGLQ